MAKGPLAAAALLLAACSSEAGAQHAEVPQPEAVQVAALTQGDCLRLSTQAEIVACMRDVSEASKARLAEAEAEIAALDNGLNEDTQTIAGQEQEAEELATTGDVLSSEIDKIYREAAKTEGGVE